MMLPRKIIVRKVTSQTTNKLFLTQHKYFSLFINRSFKLKSKVTLEIKFPLRTGFEPVRV